MSKTESINQFSPMSPTEEILYCIKIVEDEYAKGKIDETVRDLECYRLSNQLYRIQEQVVSSL